MTVRRRRVPRSVSVKPADDEYLQLLGGGSFSVGVRRAVEIAKRDPDLIRWAADLDAALGRIDQLGRPDPENMGANKNKRRGRPGRPSGGSDTLSSSRGYVPGGEPSHRATVDLSEAGAALARAIGDGNLSAGLRNAMRLLHVVIIGAQDDCARQLPLNWPPQLYSRHGSAGAIEVYQRTVPVLAASLGIRLETRRDLQDIRFPKMGGRFGDLTVRDYRRNPRKYEDRARVKEQRDRIIAGRTANYMRDGMSEEQARAEALRSMGAVDD